MSMVRASAGLMAVGLLSCGVLSCNKGGGGEAPKAGPAGGKEAGHASSAKAQAALDEVIRCLDLKGMANRFDSRREKCIRGKVPRYIAIVEGREPPAEPTDDEDVQNFEGAKKKALESARLTS